MFVLVMDAVSDGILGCYPHNGNSTGYTIGGMQSWGKYFLNKDSFSQRGYVIQSRDAGTRVIRKVYLRIMINNEIQLLSLLPLPQCAFKTLVIYFVYVSVFLYSFLIIIAYSYTIIIRIMLEEKNHSYMSLHYPELDTLNASSARSTPPPWRPTPRHAEASRPGIPHV